MSEEKNKYHTFPKATKKLKELLPLIRCAGYSNYDEAGSNIILCPECEEWTWVSFNINSGLLDLLDELIVTNIDAEDGDIRLWIKTDEFNYYRQEISETGGIKNEL